LPQTSISTLPGKREEFILAWIEATILFDIARNYTVPIFKAVRSSGGMLVEIRRLYITVNFQTGLRLVADEAVWCDGNARLQFATVQQQ